MPDGIRRDGLQWFAVPDASPPICDDRRQTVYGGAAFLEGVMEYVQKMVNAVFSVLLKLAGLLLVVMVAIVFTNVVLRYVFNSGIHWSEEVVLVIVVWFTFIAFALGVKENLHININVLPKKLPRFFENFLTILKYAVEITVGAVLFIYGLKLTRTAAASFLPATGLPNSLTYCIVPVCAVFVVIFALIRCIAMLKGKTHA